MATPPQDPTFPILDEVPAIDGIIKPPSTIPLIDGIIKPPSTSDGIIKPPSP